MSRKDALIATRAAKESRQKKIAIVGGVVLVILLAVQLPRVLGGGGSSASASASASAAAPSATAPAPVSDMTTPTPSPSAVSSGSVLPESDVPPQRTLSQLVSFERFASKDPFVQQVSDETTPPPSQDSTSPAPTSGNTGTQPAAGSAPAPAPSVTPPPTAPAAATTAPIPTAPVSGSATPVSTASARTLATSAAAATAQTATIDVNGVPETVAVSGVFPASNPTFRLVSLGSGVATIGIAGGSYASGAPTIALRAGRTVTLVNSADGVRYELRLELAA